MKQSIIRAATITDAPKRIAVLEKKQQETINPVLRAKLTGSIQALRKEERRRKRAVRIDQGKKFTVSVAAIFMIGLSS